MQILPYLPPMYAAATLKPSTPTQGTLPSRCWIPPNTDLPAATGVLALAPKPTVDYPPIGAPITIKPIDLITIQLPHPDSPVQ